MHQQITVPDIGEGVETGNVVAIHVKPGDTIQVDDTVLELETDKAVVEIPSPVSGQVVDVLVSEGDEVRIGDVIAMVQTDVPDTVTAQAPVSQVTAPDASPMDAPPIEASPEAAIAPDQPQGQPAAPQETDHPVVDMPSQQTVVDLPQSSDEGPRRPVAASPSIRRMARELGVDIQDIHGSGPGGRITEADIKNFIKQDRQTRTAGAPSTMGSAAAPGPALPDFTRWGEIERVELETVRRLTAESTATSWHMVPHVTQFDKADITDLEPFIKSNADSVAKAGGKLTVTAILAKVCAEALKRYPRFNASLDLAAGHLIYKKYIHIGIAVDTPRGLFMPVIANADTKNLKQLSLDIVDLAKRARDKKIKPTELEGGTFSISNQGGIGGSNFTPIVLWPQVAILGVSRSALEPVAQDGGFVARKILPLSLSYDHRVIDGADAARFLRWVCRCLEQPMTLFLE